MSLWLAERGSFLDGYLKQTKQLKLVVGLHASHTRQIDSERRDAAVLHSKSAPEAVVFVGESINRIPNDVGFVVT